MGMLGLTTSNEYRGIAHLFYRNFDNCPPPVNRFLN